ncbi:MFS transporter, PPP family, 3-phenylpropionic acid transporter [Novimethylophilus kurashikiensis]|uniref:MFS transporter, PPP family, 3-phenylpropionic acid transporter n=1 Tax=Novimethylophilus kurashikiensis TaxID=1825523 RepID=A0A2R5FCE5_9PROT|nr:MFS transporter [Novimethylophilus kurashikiensis]GBG15685.1 MFS transporter, PPP family, 3-phenylpropionic acid transporter [Novimethylophilus kurashikiensis]
MQALPYWRLSGFYFLYFAFVGAFTPYWSLYLKSLEFSAFQIGVLMSLLQVCRMFAPNLWGWLADHTGKGVGIVQLAAGMSMLTYLGVFAGNSFAWLFCVMAIMCSFWSASLPLMESITLRHLGEKAEHYGRIRVWGSLGFVVAVIGLGYVLDNAPIKALLWVVLGLKFGIFLFSRFVPEPRPKPYQNNAGPIWSIIKRPEVSAFLIAGFLMAAAHGVYYTFFSIYLVDLGYSKGAVGWLWSIGVVCEIMVFLWMPKLTAKFGLRNILLASFFLATVRFVMIGFGAQWVVVVVLAQTLHAASFGSYHAASVALIHRFFHGRHHAKGQAIYTSTTFGLGGTLGGLWSGWMWEPAGPALTFAVSSVATLVAFVLLYRQLRLQAA